MSDEMTTEDVFGPESDKKEPKPEPVEAKEPEPKSEDEPKAEKQEAEPKAEQKPETGVKTPPPGESKPPEGYAPIAAVEDERRKRRELQRQLDEFKQKSQAWEQQQQKVPPEFRQDPEGYLRHMQESFNQTIQQTTVVQSQQLMRSLHKDYDEMESYLVERAGADPILGAQIAAGLQQSPNPAKFAYDTAKRLKRDAEVEAAGGWDGYLERERQRIREELQGQVQQQPVVQDAPPESLAAAPSTVSQKDTFRRPSSDEIFN